MISGGAIWALLGFWGFLTGAIACAMLALWLAGTRKSRLNRKAVGFALAVVAAWCLLAAGVGPVAAWTMMAEAPRNIALLFAIYCLFATDGRHAAMQPVRPLLTTLACVEAAQPVLVFVEYWGPSGPFEPVGIFKAMVCLRLMVAVCALVLLHNLYVGADRPLRQVLRWPVAAFAALWVYDLNFYTIGYLSGALSFELATLRGLVAAAMAVPIAVGFSRQAPNLRFRPSRTVAFRSLSLLVIGAYLLLMEGIAQAIAWAGDGSSRLTQVGFLFAASVFAILWLPSDQLRRHLRVTALKHLFQHRYDYRMEWLRFTETIGRASPEASPLAERVIKVVADVAESPRGLLLVPGDRGGLVLGCGWQWPHPEVPAEALSPELARFFESGGYILNLDDLRAGRDVPANMPELPHWLHSESTAWAMVPLLHYERLAGLVVLSRPPMARCLDWEDFDLLRVIGRNLASYLAEQTGQEALREARNFDEFNRRIAFVMHDIKNLASQLALLARNAERHAENPAFREDMLVTLRSSADKLNALLARLGRYGTSIAEPAEPLALDELVSALVARWALTGPVVLVDSQPVCVGAHRESLEQALSHLAQNALDASDPGASVCVRVYRDGLNGAVEILDSGCGMSPDFVRNRLFRPFDSSKPGGFGIGAFEARELVRAMGGSLDVESREGLGTRFIVRLPEAEQAHIIERINSGKAKVA